MTDDYLTETVTHAEAGKGIRKDASFDLVEIPEPFGPVTFTIDQDKLRTFAFAVDDYSSWYFKDSPFGGPIGHPILMANDLLFLFYENYDGNTAEGLQSHERLTFHSPARVGETITVSGAYTEKFENRGHGYVVLDAEARGEDGRVIIKHHGTEIMRTRAGEVGGASKPSEVTRRVSAHIDESLPVATMAKAGLPAGTGVPGITRRFHQDQLNSFSWLARGYRNVHTDIDSARKSKVGRTFVQALQQTELIAEAMVQFFGASWFTSGELDLRYTHPAFTGDELTVSAAVVSDDGETQELEVWIDTDTGIRTALGWARARIDPSTERPHQLL